MNICSSLTHGYFSMSMKICSILNWCFPVVVSCDCESDCFGKPSSRELYKLSEDEHNEGDDWYGDIDERLMKCAQVEMTNFHLSDEFFNKLPSEYDSHSGESQVLLYSSPFSTTSPISETWSDSLQPLHLPPEDDFHPCLPRASPPSPTLRDTLVSQSLQYGENNFTCYLNNLESDMPHCSII